MKNNNPNFSESNDLTKPEPQPVKIMDIKGALIALFACIAFGFLAGEIAIRRDAVSADAGDYALLFGLLGAFVVPFLMIPFIVSVFRKHEQKWLIFAANIVLAWTGFIWVVLLLFAISGKPLRLNFKRNLKQSSEPA